MSERNLTQPHSRGNFHPHGGDVARCCLVPNLPETFSFRVFLSLQGVKIKSRTFSKDSSILEKAPRVSLAVEEPGKSFTRPTVSTFEPLVT